MKVVIRDDRTKWMQQEDKEYTCRTFCSWYRRCSSRVGYDCTKFRGDIIPAISNRK
ncbi:hypothetical protein [Bacillus sp. REN10]|uniref:hypothetical protein n=1 Tax=Bacillus sp. REN10 TaxID=2782541 RepID=UPI00193B1183|nr:hypothetical protein [Bacillus sp. REN10]